MPIVVHVAPDARISRTVASSAVDQGFARWISSLDRPRRDNRRWLRWYDTADTVRDSLAPIASSDAPALNITSSVATSVSDHGAKCCSDCWAALLMRAAVTGCEVAI